MSGNPKPTRRETLRELLRDGRWTAAGAAEAIGMHLRDCQQHIKQMEAAGELRKCGKLPKHTGRPATVWEWAAKNEA